jgi:hypothetical protein
MILDKTKKIRPQTLILAFVIIFATLFLLVGYLLCVFPLVGKMSENTFLKKAIAYAPYPAAIIGYDYVSVSKVFNRLESVRKFYENQDFSALGLRVDFSTKEGQKRLKIKEREILNKLIEDSIIEKEAKKRGVVVSEGMVDQAVDRKLKEYGTGDDLERNLDKLYGWDLNDFKKNVVKPDLVKEKLTLKIRESDPAFKKAEEKIESAKKELSAGGNFSETAKKYSEGDSAALGGDLGWFNLSQMVPEVAISIITMEKGETSGAIQSSIGYHIIKLEDRKNEEGKEYYKISQIFVRTQPFSDWLMETEKNYTIYIPLKEFYWDTEALSVKFRDDEMTKYEQKVRENPGNDPSVW